MSISLGSPHCVITDLKGIFDSLYDVLELGVVEASVSWVKRDSDFLTAVDIAAFVFAGAYLVVYLRERVGPHRQRRMRSAVKLGQV